MQQQQISMIHILTDLKNILAPKNIKYKQFSRKCHMAFDLNIYEYLSLERLLNVNYCLQFK